MTEQQIHHIVDFASASAQAALIETHISWIILLGDYAYKIKKPVQLAFVDQSTLERRRRLCQREVSLNSRFAQDLYIEVIPVRQHGPETWIGGTKGEIVDYAVKMKRLDPDKQLHSLLEQDKVTDQDITQLAQHIALMHRSAPVSYRAVSTARLKRDFADIFSARLFVKEELGLEYVNILDKAVEASDSFLDDKEEWFQQRLLKGFFRDLHGDLHSGNIFIYRYPVIFDAIEFNDEWRRLDVLDELSFLCVDFDFYGKAHLEDAFLRTYLSLFPCIEQHEKGLLTFYKMYRANVRAKVALIRAEQQEDNDYLKEGKAYLDLVEKYRSMIPLESPSVPNS